MQPYHELPGFENVYLEDSWVLGVTNEQGELRLKLDMVLTERHPRWAPPKPGEVYCYTSAELVFTQLRHVEWIREARPPSRDASGELDWGNIDVFTWDEARYELEGDWGAVIVDGDAPYLVYAYD